MVASILTSTGPLTSQAWCGLLAPISLCPQMFVWLQAALLVKTFIQDKGSEPSGKLVLTVHLSLEKAAWCEGGDRFIHKKDAGTRMS